MVYLFVKVFLSGNKIYNFIIVICEYVIDWSGNSPVVEMLEGEVECLQMPSKPFLSSSPTRQTRDVGANLNSTSSSFQSSESAKL